MSRIQRLGLRFSLVLVLIISLLILLPWLFRAKLRQGLEKGLATQLHPSFFHDTARFRVSLLAQFPHPTVYIYDAGLLRQDSAFVQDTLCRVERLSLSVRLWSLFGKTPELQAVAIQNPQIWLRQNAQGQLNWEGIEKFPRHPEDKTEADSIALDQAADWWLPLRRWHIQMLDLYLPQNQHIQLSITGQRRGRQHRQWQLEMAVALHQISPVPQHWPQLANTQLQGKVYVDVPQHRINGELLLALRQWQLQSQWQLTQQANQAWAYTLQATTQERPLAHWLGLWVSQDIDQWKTAGVAGFMLEAKGIWAGIPAQTQQNWHWKAYVRQGHLQHPQAGLPIHLQAEIQGQSQSPEAWQLHLDTLGLRWEGGRVEASGQYSQQATAILLEDTQLVLDLTANSLAKIWPDWQGLSGDSLQLQAKVAGIWSDSILPQVQLQGRWQQLQWQQPKAVAWQQLSGRLTIDNPEPDGSALQIDLAGFSGKLGENSFLLEAQWHNWQNPQLSYQTNGSLALTALLPYFGATASEGLLAWQGSGQGALKTFGRPEQALNITLPQAKGQWEGEAWLVEGLRIQLWPQKMNLDAAQMLWQGYAARPRLTILGLLPSEATQVNLVLEQLRYPLPQQLQLFLKYWPSGDEEAIIIPKIKLEAAQQDAGWLVGVLAQQPDFFDLQGQGHISNQQQVSGLLSLQLETTILGRLGTLALANYSGQPLRYGQPATLRWSLGGTLQKPVLHLK